MLKRAFQKYINNYKGFSREVWILTFVTFVNRAGTMVLPFLSKYLKEDLHFTYNQVGTILMFFGLGSLVGSWLGGKLSDKIGFYKIMIISLFTSGIGFFILQTITTFTGLCLGVFSIMVVADMFRPAMFVSLATYSKPENRTRSLTLVRLAINLGFAAGPALGGLIIMNIGYKGLFWIDGSTCILAIIIFALLVKEKKQIKISNEEKQTIEAERISVFKDKPFWIFLFTCMVSGILFFQLFTTLPLYHKEQFNLTELQSGLLLTFNGILVFLLEMPIVSYVERKKINKLKIVTLGILLMSISLLLMLVNFWVGILIIMMAFMSFGEMLVFPFANSFALSRSPKGHEGKYMAIFTMSYSCAHILSAKVGLGIIDITKSYQVNWLFMGILGLIGTYLCYKVYTITKNEKISHPISKTTFEHPNDGGEREI